ncbi:MAG: nucleotidyltransferase substrate binding protein [Clostridia bacterium]|nr:nucleotidyltransferase substrate binding protein [Clostridia bacterium]
MGRLEERLVIARRALKTLRKLPLDEVKPDDVVRDAAIQRFEYTFETLWKAAQLACSHGKRSPGCVR